jgi:hypothetical protein
MPLLKEQWEWVCHDYQLQGIFPEPKHTHCYDGQGIVQKAWLQLSNEYMSHLVLSL